MNEIDYAEYVHSMKLLTIPEGLIIAAIFAVSMFALVLLKTRTERSLEGFLVADRSVPMWQAARFYWTYG